MIRNIVTLTLNDLAIAFKNKTIYLILFIPLFVFVSLQLVDQKDKNFQEVKIGLIKNVEYSPVIVASIKATDKLFAISWLASEEEGRTWLKEKKIDGFLVASQKEPQSLDLLVLEKASFQTIAIVEGLSALQIAVEGKNKNWVSDIKSLRDSGIQKQTLPTWILMLVLLVSFIIIPAQIAEEKEKKMILGLLQTPVRECEWLLAKLFLGMILIHLAVIFLHLLGRFEIENSLSYFAFIAVGSFCFSSFGIFLGFLCRTQASARTLGVLFYLPLLLPSALSDFSHKLNAFAPVLPSYQFYGPIKAILLEGGSISGFSLEWMYLCFVGLVTYSFSYMLLKKRWLM
ncbi:MAG: ABC transporter permease [Deltaproteobacteria bacterium]|nr:ABC transporter permease [Deltaproteobacteria bacterium]